MALTDPCDGHPPCFLTANPVFGFWGISLTMLWQKAHFGSAFIAQKFRAGLRDVLNLLLFSDLHLCCNSQQFSL